MRAAGLHSCELARAQYLGVDAVLLFVLDDELGAFLPPPGFPQTLPGGAEWHDFLQRCRGGESRATLRSPFSGETTQVSGRCLGKKLVIAALGGEADPARWEELTAAGPILAAVFENAYRAQIASAEAKLAAQSAQEAVILARGLQDTRRKFESALCLAETQHRQAEETNQRLRLAQEMALMGVWEWNIKTGMVLFSDEVRRIRGMEPGRAGVPIEDVWRTYHPDDVQRVRDAVRASLESNAPYDVEFRILVPGGEVEWISARGKVYRNQNGEPVRMLGFSMDITQRKLAEEVLRSSERRASVGRLSATIAHEISNPLESITNLLYLIKGDPLLSEQARN